jgi:hypothetical protein
VQQLLEIGAVMRRIRPLMDADALARTDLRRLRRELDRLSIMLGLD